MLRVWPDTGAYIRPIGWVDGYLGPAVAAVVSRADYSEGFLTMFPVDELPPVGAPLVPVRTTYPAISGNGRVMSYYCGPTSVVCRFDNPLQ